MSHKHRWTASLNIHAGHHYFDRIHKNLKLHAFRNNLEPTMCLIGLETLSQLEDMGDLLWKYWSGPKRLAWISKLCLLETHTHAMVVASIKNEPWSASDNDALQLLTATAEAYLAKYESVVGFWSDYYNKLPETQKQFFPHLPQRISNDTANAKN